MCRPYIFILTVQILMACSQGVMENSLNQTQKDKRLSIDSLESGESYLKLTQQQFFLDKTLLIQDFIDWNETAIYITAPPKSGKTTNLQMIHAFLEIKTNPETCDIAPRNKSESYKVFKNLEIGKVKDGEFLSTHLETYPVLHLNFNRLQHTDAYKDVLFVFVYLMQITFTKYRYLLECRRWNERQRERFLNYSRGAFADTEDLLNSGAFLTELLHFQFKKGCIVLIDEFDSVILQSLFDNESRNPELKRILKFLISFLGRVVTDNMYVTKTLVTGTTRLAALLSPYGDTIKTHFFYTEPWDKYYGVSEEEIENLRKVVYPESSLDYIKRRFEGYSVPTKPSRKLFNIHSVLQYLHLPHKQNAWTQSNKHVLHHFFDFFRFDIMGLELLSLVRGDGLLVQLKQLGIDDLKSLTLFRHVFWYHGGSGVSLHSKENFFQFLTDFGFLTVTSLPSIHKMLVRIPNKEIEELLEGISFDVMKEALWVGEIHGYEDEKVLQALTDILKSLKGLNESKATHVRFMFNFETLLNNTRVPVYYEKFVMIQILRGLIYDSKTGNISLLRREIVIDRQNTTIDLVYLAENSGRAFVFEFQLNEGSSLKALEEVQGKNYTGVIRSVPSSFKKENGTVILIGIQCNQPTREHSSNVVCSESYYCVKGEEKDIDLSKAVKVSRKDMDEYVQNTSEESERSNR